MNAFMTKVLNDRKPTTDAKSERFLAVALGYPTTWRVCRRLIELPRKDDDDDDKEKSAGDNPEAVPGQEKAEDGNSQKDARSKVQSSSAPTSFIQDVIYAGNPKKGVDRWYNHESASIASLSWNGDPFQCKGGHLTKQIPKFQKNDAVEVKYGKKWYAATITKRREGKDGVKYSILYTVDESTQDNVRESSIRLAPPSSVALELAANMGLPAGWKVTRNGKRYLFQYGENIFRTKKAALDFIRQHSPEDEDPPWRTAGHELIGKQLLYSHSHKLSGVRSITVDQMGTVVGWISETDKDRHGQPGYVSEETGQPASLFHIQFEDAAGHQYVKYLLESTDMEEEEVRKYMIFVEETQPPPKKKTKR